MPSFYYTDTFIFAVDCKDKLKLISSKFRSDNCGTVEQWIMVGKDTYHTIDSVHDDVESQCNGQYVPELTDMDIESVFYCPTTPAMSYVLTKTNLDKKSLTSFLVLHFYSTEKTVPDVYGYLLDREGKKMISISQEKAEHITEWIYNCEEPILEMSLNNLIQSKGENSNYEM